MQIQIKQISFNDNIAFSVYDGSLTSNCEHEMYYFDTAHASSPFISVVLDTKARSLGKLTIDY